MNRNALISIAVLTVFLFSCQKKQEQTAAGNENANQTVQASSQQAEQTGGTAVRKDQTSQPKEYVKNENYFSLPSYSGKNIDLKDYAGKPILIMFFTENCPYCRKAAPYIEKMHQKYSPMGLAVIGISMKDSPESAKRFAADFNLTFPLAYKGSQIGKNYHVQGVPFIFLLDRNHNNYDTWMGYDPSYDADIDVTIERVLK